MDTRKNSALRQTTGVDSDGALSIIRRCHPSLASACARRSAATKRGQSGAYMIELLMALAASSLLSAALVTNMAESQRMSLGSENQIMASTLAQAQIDSTRNTPYSSLAANIGEHELKVTAASLTGSLVPVVAPRPLLLDSAKFTGRVFERIEAGPYADTLKVTVTITWAEGPASRNYSVSTLVAKNGINNTGVQAPAQG